MSDEQTIIDALNAGASAEGPEVKEASPVAATPSPSPSSTESPTALSLKDEDVLEFLVGGQPIRKPWKEIRETQAMRPADYTRKTQALAEERKAFLAERDGWAKERDTFNTYRDNLAKALQDPAQIEALYLSMVARKRAAEATGGAPQPSQPVPADPRQLIESLRAEIRKEFQTQQSEFALNRQNEERANVLLTHVNGILDAHPLLKATPKASDHLFDLVTDMVVEGQTTLEEVKEFLNAKAQEWNDALQGHLTSTTKAEATQAAAKLNNGIVPGRSTPPIPQGRQYDRKKGPRDPYIEKDLIDMFKQGMSNE